MIDTPNQSRVAVISYDGDAADMARMDAQHRCRAIGTKEQEGGEEGEGEGERAGGKWECGGKGEAQYVVPWEEGGESKA